MGNEGTCSVFIPPLIRLVVLISPFTAKAVLVAVTAGSTFIFVVPITGYSLRLRMFSLYFLLSSSSS